MSSTKGANGAMSKKDRDALIRVVKTRFALLHTKLHQRRQEIKNRITEELSAEVAAESKKMEAKAKRLEKKAKALIQEGEALAEEAEGLGVVALGTHRRMSVVQATVMTKFAPMNLGSRVQKAMNLIEEQGGAKGVELTEQELTLIEELLVGGLDSAAGKNFLDRIPTAEGLLPMPTPKQIEATAEVVE